MLSDRIRERTKELGMSQSELARRSGLSRGYISDIFRGRSGIRPSHQAVGKLKKALRVGHNFFYLDEPEKSDMPPENVEV